VKYKILAIIILILGIAFRLYHIEFGLPQSFYADEPEISEPAINYTYEIRNIINNNDYYKLIPISFVYGALPVYIMTLSLMAFSKSLNLLNIAFDKTTIFIFLRVVTVLISTGVILVTTALAKKHFENTRTVLLVLFLIALNWKFIVLSHYANADIVLVLMLLLSFYMFWLYNKNPTNKNLFLAGIFFGLAVGTKVTALISLPMFLYLIWRKRDFYGLPGFIFSALIAFMVSNPFSIIFFKEFGYRIFGMFSKEGGLVFDSMDSSPFKYLLALLQMVTPIILGASVYGAYRKIKHSLDKNFDVFLVANVALYLIFFSFQSRRVDRWLLPILPVVFMYAAFGIEYVFEILKKPAYKIALVVLVFGIYLINPILLLTQFQRWTPKAQAYLWAQTNLPEIATKLVYTEEGLDPMNKLGFAKVIKFQVYASDGAQLFYPENPLAYEYIFLSSRPMENFKRPEVVKAYPYYAYRWEIFEKTVQDSKYFEVVKDFTLTKPNLIPLSDVVIYKRL